MVQDNAVAYIPIWSPIWVIDRRHFQWPWTTPNPYFKVMAIFDAEYVINGTYLVHYA